VIDLPGDRRLGKDAHRFLEARRRDERVGRERRTSEDRGSRSQRESRDHARAVIPSSSGCAVAGRPPA
jgi:hypothetical protein